LGCSRRIREVNTGELFLSKESVSQRRVLLECYSSLCTEGGDLIGSIASLGIMLKGRSDKKTKYRNLPFHLFFQS
jgi:hypothetical protein